MYPENTILGKALLACDLVHRSLNSLSSLERLLGIASHECPQTSTQVRGILSYSPWKDITLHPQQVDFRAWCTDGRLSICRRFFLTVNCDVNISPDVVVQFPKLPVFS